MGGHLAACILCGRRVAAIGIFIPASPEMQAAVMVLRRYAPPEGSTPGLVYGLCKKHVRQDVTPRVEAVLVSTARRVTVQ